MTHEYDGYSVYKIYVMMKLHFTSPRYDFFKYGGKAKNLSVEAYRKRPDRHFFETLSKRINRSEYVPYFVANFVMNPDKWIGNIGSNTEGHEVYLAWRKRIESFNELLKEDIHNIKFLLEKHNTTFDKMIEAKPGQHSAILRLLLEQMISIETFICLNKIHSFIPIYDTIYTDDLIWETLSFRCLRYESFISSIIEKSQYKYLCQAI